MVSKDGIPLYAVRWNKLLDLVIDLAVAQGTYERSPHVHMQELIDEVNKLRDPLATGIAGDTPQRVSARSKAVKPGASSSKRSPKKNK